MPTLPVMQLALSLKTGGLERLVLDLLRQGPEMGVDYSLCLLEEEGDLAQQARDLGAPVFVLGKRPGLDFSLVPRLRALMRRGGVRVLHSHNQAPGFYGGLAALWAGRPQVLTRHGASYGMDRSWRWVSALAAHLSRCTVCVGSDALAVARREDRLPARRLRLIYNGVDTELFKPDAALRAAARAELGLADAHKVVISVGRVSSEKDYATLLKALAVMPPAWRLVLVGDGPELENLRRLAAELDLGRRALLLGRRADVERLLAAADLFALSSLSEGVSVALLEAMAAGLPVVATRVGGTPEVVVEGETGLLLEPGLPHELALALQDALEDPRRATAWGAAGRRRVEERFSLRAMAAAYAALYREVA
ncbi:MAG: glycosyltransferase [Thermodesulfobacteriota bacterium]